MNGFFNIYKSSGTNSTFIVNKIKRITKTPCGHMGTLDPMASGVLAVGIGKTTRLFNYLLDNSSQILYYKPESMKIDDQFNHIF